MTLQERVLEGMDLTRRIVEIGPLYRPFVSKSGGNVVYVDHADTATLREKYKDDPKFSMDAIVDVDAVWGDKTLAECIGEPASYIIASHVIEHVPDLFTWLNELRDALLEGGQIRLVIPDRRFTFDYLRRTTEFADVIDAYLRKTRAPLPRCVLDHVLNVRNVDVGEAWAGPLDPLSLTRPPGHGYDLAVRTARQALSGEYHDVHCWVFTPRSFASLMRQAVERKLLNLRCAQFSDTMPGTLEFVVFVEPCRDSAETVASWTKMETVCFEQTDPEIVRLNAELESTSLNAEHHRERCDSLAAELQVAQTALEEMRLNVEHYRERCDCLAAELQVAQTAFDEIRCSTSWRVTAPMRRVVEAVRSRGFAASRHPRIPRHKAK